MAPSGGQCSPYVMPPTSPQPSVIRFVGFTLLAAGLIGCVGRVISDFDLPAEQDPHDTLRGIGIWVVAVLIAVLTERAYVRREVAIHRRNLGHCLGCGYDLRESPDRCPECGRAVDRKA